MPRRASSRKKPSLTADQALEPIRLLIYFYAILWLVEGALRKWLLPGLSDILLLLRDPLVLVIYSMVLAKGKFPFNGFIIAGIVLSFLSFMAAVVMGHGNLGVAIYGVRTMILHLPLLFIIPQVMDMRHVRVIAKATLWVVIPMTALMVLQFLSPSTAWVNKGLGGVGTAGFTGALGRMRPPGTFSFVMGPVLLYPFATAAWFTVLLAANRLSPLLLASGAAILLAAPISISRALMISCIFVLAVGVVALLSLGARHATLMVRALVGAGIAIVIATNVGVFKEGTAAFGDRWERSTTSAGGFQVAILDRFVGAIVEPVKIGLDAPVFGYGIGAGTNVGSKLLTGQAFFIAGESEPGRLLMENGFILGWGWLILRFVLLLAVGNVCLVAWKGGNKLPLVIFASCGLSLFIGSWGQPTLLGFSVFACGLSLAACREVKVKATQGIASARKMASATAASP